jgi:hypothetical protein
MDELRVGQQEEWWGEWWGDADLPRKQQDWDFVVDSYSGLVMEVGWNRAPCKRCEEIEGKEDYKASLGFNTRTRGYNCMKCGLRGMLPPNYAEELIEGATPIEDIVALSAEPEPEVPIEQPRGLIRLFVGDSQVAWAEEYMTQSRDTLNFHGQKCRGISQTACFEARLAAAPYPASDQRKLTNRVIVPVPDYLDPEAPLRGWVARDVTGSARAPYLNAKGMHRDDLLFNEPALYVETDDPVFIVEGTMDALRWWPHAVAVLGKPIPPHCDLITRARRPVVVMLDGDAWEEGRAFMWQLKLKKYEMAVGNLKLPPKTDPDDYGLTHSWPELREQGLRTIK